jgi:hypothetical protein
VRDRGGGGGAESTLQHQLDPVGRQHLDRTPHRRLGKGVSIGTEEERPVDPLDRAVLGDRLGDREDVRLVERAQQRAAAVAGGAERDPLPRGLRVGAFGVVGGDQTRHIDQQLSGRRLTGERVDGHGLLLGGGRAAGRSRTELDVGLAGAPADGRARVSAASAGRRRPSIAPASDVPGRGERV